MRQEGLVPDIRLSGGRQHLGPGGFRPGPVREDRPERSAPNLQREVERIPAIAGVRGPEPADLPKRSRNLSRTPAGEVYDLKETYESLLARGMVSRPTTPPSTGPRAGTGCGSATAACS